MFKTEKVVVTERPGAPRDKAIIQTPSGAADVQIVTMSWWKQSIIRTARTYMQGLVGFLVAGGTGAADAMGINMPVHDFVGLFVASASLAVAPAVITLLQNAVEILTRLDNPQIRA